MRFGCWSEARLEPGTIVTRADRERDYVDVFREFIAQQLGDSSDPTRDGAE
jgi:hypothetical protein